MKARTKMHKLLSMLLALVMVVGLLPAMGQVAYAYSEGDIAGTTGSGASKEDPVVCDTFAEFKAAMENTEITYVKLTGASGVMPSRETLSAAISNTTYKVLTIEGTNRFWSPLNGNNDCLIWPRNELTINGTGTLKYEHGNTGGTGAVINMASNVSLKIDGNVTLEGGANGKSYGYAIFAQAGTTKINGGSFIGYSASINDNADVSAVIINSSANLTINGGNFSASLHQNSPEGKKAHSLSITSTATGAISIKEGTFPQGINIKARGKTIENCGYFDTAKASITADGNAVATTASTDVLNGKNVVVTDTSIIASVAVAVTEPVAGAQPQNGVSNTANVNVTITEWYHNGVKMLATDTFAAGETYKVHVIVKPNSGYEFADNPTATFNGSTAGTIYMYGKDYINYYAEFTVPAASTPTTIDTVAISVTAPTAGAAPVVEPAGLPTGVTCEPVLTTVTGWYDSETNTKMASTEKFVEGKTYYICLFLSADTGYSFANPITTATINGDNATIELNNDGYLAIKKSFVASASATTIDTIAVTVTVPVAGAAPVVAPAGLPTGVTCEPVLTTVTGWYDSETNTKMASTEKFVEGKTYYICLFLSADTGYAFANPVTTATINGVDATIELNNDGYLAIKKSFVATAAATTEYDITVTDGKATIGAGTEISKAAEGTEVALTANAAPSGQVFDKWVVVSGSITLADANSATTTFTMPAEVVSVKATYKDTPHTHTFDQKTIMDAALKTAADCTHDAVYYKSCACGEAISTNDDDTFTATDSALGHAWPEEGSWSKDADKHWYECSRCHLKKDEAAHTPDHTGHATEEYAIKCTECGYVIEAQLGHTHVFDKEVATDAYKASDATCTAKATYYKSCACGEKGTETFEYGELAEHNWTPATCTAPKTCSVCHATEGDPLGHTEGTEWKSDKDNHWHTCTVAGCGVVIESSKAAHTPDREAATETDPIKCSVCDYIITPALGMQDYIVEMPVSIAIKLTGDKKPAKETFKFEIYDLGCEDTEFEILNDTVVAENVEFDENGVAFLYGFIKIKVVGEEQLCNLTEGFNVRMVKGTAKGWTYAAEQWYVELFFKNDALDVGIAVKEIVDGEISEAYANGMSFSLGYEAVTEPGTPQTGDNSVMGLWIALLVVSGFGVVATAVYGKKRKSVK